MSARETKKASLALRLLGVLAVTVLAVFVIVVASDNVEIRKIFPNTTARRLMLFTAASVAILTTNYFSAHLGRNLMDWRTEILVAATFILLCASLSLPFLFEVDVMSECSLWERVTRRCNPTVVDEQPAWHFLWLFVLQVPLLAYTVARVRYFWAREAMR